MREWVALYTDASGEERVEILTAGTIGEVRAALPSCAKHTAQIVPVDHVLRSEPELVEQAQAGLRTFEVRQDTRGYKTGDIVLLVGYSHAKRRRTGVLHAARIGSTSHYRIMKGYVGFSLVPVF